MKLNGKDWFWGFFGVALAILYFSVFKIAVTDTSSFGGLYGNNITVQLPFMILFGWPFVILTSFGFALNTWEHLNIVFACAVLAGFIDGVILAKFKDRKKGDI